MSRLPFVVVGAGMAGLSAALELRRLAPGVPLVVLESSGRVGGKVWVSEVGGLAVDEGADSLLRRVPEAVALAEQVGLGRELVSPATGQAALWSRGRLRALPAGTVMGVPADLGALARNDVLTGAGLARAALDLLLPGAPTTDDVAVGALVGARMGREVVSRLVDPLLGGVYAGRPDLLSLRATLPQLAAPLRAHRSLLVAARAARGRPGSASGPVFAGLPGGLGRLPQAAAAALAASGARLQLRTTVRELARTPRGWRLTTGSRADPTQLEAAGVVLAVPGPPAARLLRPLLPAAAAELASLDYASVAVVTLVLAGALPGTGSGYLVPAGEGLATKAVTVTSRKWAHYPADRTVLRASLGRYGDAPVLQRDDAELVALVRRELEQVHGPLPPVLATRVVRWGGALPQYAVGHLDRVRRIRAAVAQQPRLAVAGAAYDGVGVPAVVRGGREAAAALLDDNGEHDPDPSAGAQGQ